MHVALGIERQLVMHDVIHRRNVETSRRNVRRDQYAVRLGAESLEVLEARTLLHLGVQRIRRELEQRQQRAQSTQTIDRVRKDDGPARISMQKVVEIDVLLLLEARDLGLLQVRGRDLGVANVDHLLLGLVEVDAGHENVCRDLARESAKRSFMQDRAFV